MAALQPLFDPRTCHLVAWISVGEFIFDLDMEPVAFIIGGRAFSMENGEWLGLVNVRTLLSRSGKPVAFNPDQGINHKMEPMVGIKPVERAPLPPKPTKPMQPETPITPEKPRTPIQGWSSLNFEQWLKPFNGNPMIKRSSVRFTVEKNGNGTHFIVVEPLAGDSLQDLRRLAGPFIRSAGRGHL